MVGLFSFFRRLERWLHQHIFKVGWLFTKNFQTTTIIYYGFFLPGVFLYELSVWLAAGMLNISAERSFQLPKKQDVAELDLSFIKLPKNVPPLKLSLITLAPFISGLLAIWIIAYNILDITVFVRMIERDGLGRLGDALSTISTAPDFWLWIYLAFTISNTMVPDFRNIKGIRFIIRLTLVILVVLFVIGVGDEIIGRVFAGPVAEALYLLAGILLVMIALDIFSVVVLGTIEAAVERVTGHSATFEKGKLVAITRQELLEMKRRPARALTSGQRATSKTALPSVYNLHLPIPGPPEKETVTRSGTQIIEPVAQETARPLDDRRGPDMITSTASLREDSAEEDQGEEESV